MLAKRFRLKKTNDFKAVYERGRLTRGDFIDLRFVKNKADNCRFGFVVSLNISKKATVRNKIKRHLGEAAANFISQTKEAKDILFIAKPKIINKNQKEMIKDAENIIKKAKLLD